MSSTPVVTRDNHMNDDIWSSSSSTLNMPYEDELSSKQIIRRMNDSVLLETRLTQLTNENEILRAKIDMLNRRFLNQTATILDMDPSVSSTTDQRSNLFNLLLDC